MTEKPPTPTKPTQYPCPYCRKPVPIQRGENACRHCGKSWTAILPQEGPQEQCLRLRWVDILVYGGAAGGGKTWYLLLDPIQDMSVPGWGGVYFRREAKQITNQGGLWDEAKKVYPHLGGSSRLNPLQWVFSPNGNSLDFAHLHEEDSVYSWQGSQIPWIGFDELTHFAESQFWYMQSRNRSMCGVRCRTRASVNPDASSWVKRLIAPWVDDVYPDRATFGEVLWLVHDDPDYHFFRTKSAAMEQARKCWPTIDMEQLEYTVKSITFVEASLSDNKELLKANPGYLANLLSLPEVERQRLLFKNWNISIGKFFDTWAARTLDGTPWHVIPDVPCKMAGGRDSDGSPRWRHEIPKGHLYYLALDWGYNDPFAAYLVGVAPDGRKTVYHELYLRHTETADQGTAMMRMCADHGLDHRTLTMYAGHDVFNRRLKSDGTYDEPIVETWSAQHFQAVSAGRDPLFRAEAMRKHLKDWGPDLGWTNGRPGIQICEGCVNLIRTLPTLTNDKNNTEVVDTDLEDHAYDAIGHLLTSVPDRPTIPQDEQDMGEDTRVIGSLQDAFLSRAGMLGDDEGTEEYDIW